MNSNASVKFLESQQQLVNLVPVVYRNAPFYNGMVVSALKTGNRVAVENTAAQFGVYQALAGSGLYSFQMANVRM